MSISQYPYLSLVLIFFAIFICCYILSGSHRKTLLLAGLLSAPGSLLTFILVPDYWNPVRLFGWEPGIEDILFSFTTGAIVWFFAVGMRSDDKLTFNMHWNTGVRRYLKVYVIGAISLALVSLFGSLPIMYQVLITMLTTSLLITRHHRNTYYLALSTSVLFGVFYTMFAIVAFRLFPDFTLQWNRADLWTTSFLSVPVDEIIWACTFGYTFTLIMSYTLGLVHQSHQPLDSSSK